MHIVNKIKLIALIVMGSFNISSLSAADFSVLAGSDSDSDADVMRTPKRKIAPALDENTPATAAVKHRDRRYRLGSDDGDKAIARVQTLDAAVRADPSRYADGSPARRMGQAKGFEVAAAFGSPLRWVPGDGILDADGKLRTDMSPPRVQRYGGKLEQDARAETLVALIESDQKLVADGIVPAHSPAVVAGAAVPLHAYAVLPVDHVVERHISPKIIGGVLAEAATGETTVTPEDPRTRRAGKPATIFSPVKYGGPGADVTTRTRAVLDDFRSSELLGVDSRDARITQELFKSPRGHLATIAAPGVAGKLAKKTVFTVHVTRFTRPEALNGTLKPVYTDNRGRQKLLSVAEARGIKAGMERAGRTIASYANVDGSSRFYDLAPGIPWGPIASPKMGVFVEIPN